MQNVMCRFHLVLVILLAVGTGHTVEAGLLDNLVILWGAATSLLIGGFKLIQKAVTGDYMAMLKQLKIISNETKVSLITLGDTPMDIAVTLVKGFEGDGFAEALQALGIVPDPMDRRMVRPNDPVQRRCYRSAGVCLNFDPAWYHPKYRQFNAFPQKAEQINISILVNSFSGSVLTKRILQRNNESYMRSGFNVDKNTFIYIHGFLGNPENERSQRLIRKLLAAEQGSLNVLTVDWRRGSRTRYTQAVGNTLMVAWELHRTLEWLMKQHGLQLRRVHLVGHSLGAHLAGYVGFLLPGIGRITGLDPAKPGFENMPPDVRLDSTDALFVDVLHTDVGNDTNNGWGTRQLSGHVDFYVNGGVDQPGCTDPAAYVGRIYDRVVAGTGEMDIACLHNRAIELFIDSIEPNEGCQFVAHECKSYKEYLKGSCSTCSRRSHCSVMGYHASRQGLGNRSNVKLFLTTGRQAPFCLSPSSIKISLSKPVQGSPVEFHGRLRVSVVAARSGVLEVTLPINYLEANTTDRSRMLLGVLRSVFSLLGGSNNAEQKLTLREGSSYGFLLRSQTVLGEVSRVSVTWLPDDGDHAALPKRRDRLPLVAELTLQDMSSMYGSRRLFYASIGRPGVQLIPYKVTHFYSR